MPNAKNSVSPNASPRLVLPALALSCLSSACVSSKLPEALPPRPSPEPEIDSLTVEQTKAQLEREELQSGLDVALRIIQLQGDQIAVLEDLLVSGGEDKRRQIAENQLLFQKLLEQTEERIRDLTEQFEPSTPVTPTPSEEQIESLNLLLQSLDTLSKQSHLYMPIAFATRIDALKEVINNQSQTPEELARIQKYQQLVLPTVRLQGMTFSGSGIIVQTDVLPSGREEVLIATAWHVVRDILSRKIYWLCVRVSKFQSLKHQRCFALRLSPILLIQIRTLRIRIRSIGQSRQGE